jgi:hypothetical protein
MQRVYFLKHMKVKTSFALLILINAYTPFLFILAKILIHPFPPFPESTPIYVILLFGLLVNFFVTFFNHCEIEINESDIHIRYIFWIAKKYDEKIPISSIREVHFVYGPGYAPNIRIKIGDSRSHSIGMKLLSKANLKLIYNTLKGRGIALKNINGSLD